MKRAATGVVGAVVEAWQEFRIHKTRVLLSLIGVAFAVCALTTVVGLGRVAQQANVESNERQGGRPATLTMQISAKGGKQVDTQLVQDAWEAMLKRYHIRYASRLLQTRQRVQFANGAKQVSVQAVDQAYQVMHRLQLSHGSWFGPEDSTRLAPAVVVNETFWRRIGSPDLRTHPTVTILGEQDTTAVVIGVYSSSSWSKAPAMYMLDDAYSRLVTEPAASDELQGFSVPMQYQMWVPQATAHALDSAITNDFTAALPDGSRVNVERSDFGARGGDPYLPMKLMVGGAALLVLLLGALGLVNIALVTVRYRIREIGIRRSFGASAGRVFFSVMMESVVATVVAGACGVTASVLIVTNPSVENLIGQGMVTDFPPFPIEVALLGFAAAVAVGALAGILPALIAVRVKVIDAIRY